MSLASPTSVPVNTTEYSLFYNFYHIFSLLIGLCEFLISSQSHYNKNIFYAISVRKNLARKMFNANNGKSLTVLMRRHTIPAVISYILSANGDI